MISVIALDIYGTVLATDDPDNELPVRKGIESFFNECGVRRIRVASTSDAPNCTVKVHLEDYGLFRFLDSSFQLNQLPHKNFEVVLNYYGIQASELLVIGDSDKDINGAISIGARHLRVPEYISFSNDFDFGQVLQNI